MKIAVVGTGISGMVSAYLLSADHEVTVFEANDYVGGHTHTVDVDLEGQTYAVDTGFIVYNDWTYPNFIKLLDRLGVDSKPSVMGFSVRCEESGLEYNGGSINGVFAQRSNIVSPAHWRMLADIARFFREARAFLEERHTEMSLGAFLEARSYSARFRDKFIVPMMAAIWSTGPRDVAAFPARHFLAFFENHGLLSIRHRPQWRVIKGGSRQYAEKLIAPFRDRIRLCTPVRNVRRFEDHVVLQPQGGPPERFEHVVIAAHSDQALALLEDPSDAEREILGAIPYTANDTVLHTDDSVLPTRKRAWASWNYHLPREMPDKALLTYNMNMLQGLDAPQVFCVTLNDPDTIDPGRIFKRFLYHHPVLSAGALAAQKRHREISGVRRTHYCGAYWGYGFHEHGVESALAACAWFGKRLD